MRNQRLNKQVVGSGEVAKPTLTRTERGKIDKNRRIRDASRALFVSRGFEDTTVREIAQLAGVAQGTLFLYAASKRDLLFMLYNDLLEDVVRASEGLADSDLSVLEYFMESSRLHFIRLIDDMAIARCALVHLNLYDKSEQSDRFTRIAEQTTDSMRKRLERAAESGELAEPFSVDLMAMMSFSLIVEMFRRFIRAELPDIRESMEQTCGQMTVLLKGLGATADALVIRSPELRRFLGSGVG